MNVYEAIRKRRDIRSYYKPDPIPDEVLARILSAAHLAPSVGYSQPWNFIIIRDTEIRKKIKQLVEEERKRFENILDGERRAIFSKIKVEAILDSPINIAVTYDPNRFGPNILGRTTMPETSLYSTVLAIGNLWLAATAEGIGVGFVSFFNKERVKEILKIPKEIELVGYLTLGYVKEFPKIPELEEKGWNRRLMLSDLVFEDIFGNKLGEHFRLLLDRTFENIFSSF
ncbi:5,6-dimethylbenzimidazole synthase [Saccharolobus shibatae]|uniref:Cobalamin biosynthesis protein BluB 5,6-dimethylbenzimidazole synthase, flavin destructase family n=1 Tax=Saccharolobus shibatae TaxID=2286 RepID=A0A8F5GVW7_9CREN|nr:5,6-dimethylbenzimidazole synthase [Saccharolobus shibatae]QXJ31381.1 Cobalamin biosynthesis protein BluB 5,6-dimethylbenzimidazole synthase, flavin destructase family [Saccharolobus shibatae]